MRNVAQALGVVPMTLYTYVPGKAELLDLMMDAAYAQMLRADTSAQPWRQHAYDFGLQRVLDGLAVLIDRRY
jgi:AcrR family transcriptional regulator